MSKKVIVGMSGGVDSSVAASLLLEQGYQVEGLFMKNWEQDDNEHYCAAAVDLADAQAVAAKLNIILHCVNFTPIYWDRVFEHFLTEYQVGRTPNPDVLCNKEIKFNAFLQHAQTLGADYIATGHYAQIKDNKLCKAKDRNKDQTYFLHAISTSALEKTLFPIGSCLKQDVRAYAKAKGLITHNKKDSTGICFIGERRFKTFLNEFVLAKPGDICSTNGSNLGRHDGLMFYTIGQRHGLGIGGIKNSNNEPWFVVDKDLVKNQLLVAQGYHHPMLYGQGLICGAIHWLISPPTLPHPCYAKIRYRQQEEPCIISPCEDGQHVVMFSTTMRAITPGQYIVFYQQNYCLGGAVIEQIIR